MFEIDISELGADASDLIDEQKREIEHLFRVSLKEVEIEAPSIRELAQRIIDYLPSVVDACAEGLDAALEVLAVVKGLKDRLESEEKKLLVLALDEARWFSKEEIKSEFGLTLSSTADILKYSQDEEYVAIKELLEERKSKLKSAYRHYSTRLEPVDFFDEETGEMIPQIEIKTFGGQTLKRMKKK